MTKDEVLKRLCRLSARVDDEVFHFDSPADCFCGQSEPSLARDLFVGDDYRYDETVLAFIEHAVEQAIAAHVGGAKVGLAEAKR